MEPGNLVRGGDLGGKALTTADVKAIQDQG
jgi:hypothetical protein